MIVVPPGGGGICPGRQRKRVGETSALDGLRIHTDEYQPPEPATNPKDGALENCAKFVAQMTTDKSLVQRASPHTI
jgi:hypothetical protein